MNIVLLEAAEPAGFMFWFLTELFYRKKPQDK
jgi:hypothetical protein